MEKEKTKTMSYDQWIQELKMFTSEIRMTKEDDVLFRYLKDYIQRMD